MPRYTLKTFYGTKELERYEHRFPPKLASILRDPRFYKAGERGPWDEELSHPDRFMIVDSHKERLFDGNIADLMQFIKTLR